MKVGKGGEGGAARINSLVVAERSVQRHGSGHGPSTQWKSPGTIVKGTGKRCASVKTWHRNKLLVNLDEDGLDVEIPVHKPALHSSAAGDVTDVRARHGSCLHPLPRSVGPLQRIAMSLLDKVIAAVVPEPTPEERAETRAKARSLSGGTGWLAQVLDHHEQIDAALDAVRTASTPATRRAAQKWLGTLLTGHSMAEEAVLYPAMALGSHQTHATEAYAEQSGAKVQTAGLDELDPMSKDYLDKLEHLRLAVAMHVHREESDWFPELRKSGEAATQAKLSRRYKEEFERYMGAEQRPT